MISQESIERVRNEASIVEVVSESVKLRRSGVNYTGLCPFHSERSPSFFVREQSNTYHCFGCGESGNVISFVMKTRALSFPDAVEFLATRSGIELKYDSAKVSGPRIDRERLFQLCSVAQLFFRKSLMNVKGGQGEYLKVGEYLRQRGLNAEAINSFGIGFCPNQRGALLEVLKKAGYDLETILMSGLVRRSQSGELYELFRGRLLFPIFVDAKRIAGFGGRLVPGVQEAEYEKQSPKYVNSPETPIYQKSKTFYGLPQAFSAIRESGEVYVVEGYMDVVGLAMRGVRNVVACCGTALTEQHLKRLAGVCSRVFLLFDGDDAGRAAAAKSFNTARNAEVDVKACFLPDGIDPDDFAKLHGERTAQALGELPKGLLIDAYIDGLLRTYGIAESEQPGPNLLGKIVDEVARALKGINHAVVLSSLISRAARRLKIETSQIESLVGGAATGGKGAQLGAGRYLAQQQGGSAVAQAAPAHVAVNQAAQGQTQASPGALPKSDQALLRVVMVLRERVLSEVINNSDICEMLAPASLQFMLGLSELIAGAGDEEERVKAEIKQYLQELGSDWLAFWKEAHQIMLKSGEDGMSTYQKTLLGFKRERLMRLLKESQQELVANAENPELQAEFFDRIRALKSQLDNMVRG